MTVCPYCVQLTCPCPDGFDCYDQNHADDWYPALPDGTRIELTQDTPCGRCAAAIAEYQASHQGEA